jgi:hypothetical protein
VDPAFISHQGQEKFFVGINLGNVNLFPFHKAPYRFASVEDATSEAPGSLQREAVQAMLRQEFAKMAANGINAVRVWLHIDGGQNPVFDEQGLVSDISQPFLEDLKFLIRTADANGIALVPRYPGRSHIEFHRQPDPGHSPDRGPNRNSGLY